jgi:hypothetical protein
MLAFLRERDSSSERKLRLFAVACSRRIWPWIDALGRQAVDLAEDFADGLATAEQLRAARLTCQGTGGQASWYAAASNPAIAARNAARSAQAGADRLAAEAEELAAQAALVREIFGPRPCTTLTIDRDWLTPDVIALAQEIYTERAFDRLPLLAKMLETGGCSHGELLSHCRAAGAHVRGCWALDLLLGKG